MTQSGWLKAAATAIALFLPSMSAAQGVAGDYLAARQAGMTGDFEQAARYFDRALMFDPENLEFMDRGALSYLSLGNVERAAVLGNRILESGQSSQVAQMAVMAERLGKDDYAGAIDMIAQNRGVGPLVDGLITAWSQLGQGDMSAALVAFEKVGETQGLEPFAVYHKALALASVGDYEGDEKSLRPTWLAVCNSPAALSSRVCRF
jgi:tetratricopeptide (TPR) repeat protein